MKKQIKIEMELTEDQLSMLVACISHEATLLRAEAAWAGAQKTGFKEKYEEGALLLDLLKVQFEKQ